MLNSNRLIQCGFWLAQLVLYVCLSSCASYNTSPTITATEIQLNSTARQPFRSFDQASQELKDTLITLGFGSFEGDHVIGNVESFAAYSSGDNEPELRINTAWQTTEPLGTYRLLNNSTMVSSGVLIARLDATGVWVDCGDFQIELLSTGPIEDVLNLSKLVEERLGCSFKRSDRQSNPME